MDNKVIILLSLPYELVHVVMINHFGGRDVTLGQGHRGCKIRPRVCHQPLKSTIASAQLLNTLRRQSISVSAIVWEF